MHCRSIFTSTTSAAVRRGLLGHRKDYPAHDAPRQTPPGNELRDLALHPARLVLNAFEHSQIGMAITDASGTIVLANEAFDRLAGCSRGETTGWAVSRFFALLRSSAQPGEETAPTGSWQQEMLCRRESGESLPVLMTVDSLPVSGSTGLFLRTFVTLASDSGPCSVSATGFTSTRPPAYPTGCCCATGSTMVWLRRNAQTARWRCCSSTLTTSRQSTRPMAMQLATRRWASWPSACKNAAQQGHPGPAGQRPVCRSAGERGHGRNRSDRGRTPARGLGASLCQ